MIPWEALACLRKARLALGSRGIFLGGVRGGGTGLAVVDLGPVGGFVMGVVWVAGLDGGKGVVLDRVGFAVELGVEAAFAVGTGLAAGGTTVPFAVALLRVALRTSGLRPARPRDAARPLVP